MRTDAREYAFKLVFESFFRVCETDALDKLKKEEDQKFANELFEAYQKNSKKIEDIIVPLLKNFTFDRLKNVDKAVLCLACAELLEFETPIAVVANEYVGIAKKYSDEKSGKFVNGMLAEIFKQMGSGNV